ncbi:RNA polymerase sigma factor [Nonomuraea sp. NPDC050547]|uniref:RNA polymerase sigma factor n=1 Tax=Nonomuraea sp. NPDC050547 TaxID=3364368 RepID=UPI0037A835AA
MAATHVEKPPEASLDDFDAVFDAYFPEIHRYVAQRLGPDHADDVVAETFLTAFRKRARFDPGRAALRSWLYGIATNLVGKHRRTEIRALRAMNRHGAAPDSPGHEERVTASVSAQSLRPALAAAIAAAAYRALAGMPHVKIVEGVENAGTAIEFRLQEGQPTQVRVIIDPETSMVTSYQVTGMPGKGDRIETVLASGWTDEKPAPPTVE